MDFSKHVFTQAHGVYSLETAPGTKLYAVHLINAHGRCFVTGDYGDWAFCREWHPFNEWYVAPHYFAEKVSAVPRHTEAGSFYEYDPEATRRNIQEDENLPIEQQQELLNASGDEDDLVSALEKYGLSASDYLSNKLTPYLQIILDALNEMIKRAQQ